MRAQHGMKAVRGGKDDLGYYFSPLGYERGRQYIFNIVREFAELPEAASGGIALERVHRPAHASQGVRVRGVGFQKDSGLVQLLQDILRALKEEFAKFRGAFIGKEVQSPASIR